MKLAPHLFMKKCLTVSKWYALVLFIATSPTLANAQSSVITTGYATSDGKQDQGAAQPGGGLSSGTVPPGVLVVDPNVSYPNISKELTDQAKDKDPNNATAASEAQKLLQSLLTFGQGDYDRPPQSGWTPPDGDGSQSYRYRPEPGYENAPAVDNNFPKTCDLKTQSIPLNPSGVTAESLKGHKCSPYDDRLTCMVCNLFHEARGESGVGQLAVAQNVMTRVFNGKFPDTVCKVVWEYKQYSWTFLKSVPKNLNYDTGKIQQRESGASPLPELFLP